jgi:gliding motility-associated-like protein
MRGINAIFSTDNPFMPQRPFSVILSRRSLSTIRPCCIVLLLLLLRAGDGYGQIFTFSVNPTSASCGLSNGALSIVLTGVPAGAVAPYTYYLTPPVGLPLAQVGNGNFTGLAGGTYGLQVIDASGMYTSGVVQSYSIYASTAPSITATPNPTAALCASNIGTIDVTYTGGGQTPISYALDMGAYGQSGATVASFTGLAAGAHTVYAQDYYHCITPITVIVPLSIDLYLTMPNDTTICQGLTAQLKPTTNATTFAWTPATSLNNAAIADPVAAPSTTTTYTLSDTLGVCNTTGTVTVNVLPAPIAAAVSPVGTCYGKSVELQGSGGASYQWSPSTYLSNPEQQDPIMVEPHSSVTYQLTVVGANGCTSLKPATVVVNVVPPLKVYAGDDTSVVVGQTVPMDAVDVDGVGFTQFAWTPAAGLSNANIQDPAALVSASITYTVTATAPDGCQGVDSMTIKAFTSQADIFVPNAFTPNNDGHNDLLRAIPIGITQFKYFTVYNRWGQQVFTTTNASLGWDGTLSGHVLLPGTFVWVAAGVDYTGKLVQRKGVVILIR